MSGPRGGCHELEDGTGADRVLLSRERSPALSTGQLNHGDLRSDTARRRVRTSSSALQFVLNVPARAVPGNWGAVGRIGRGRIIQSVPGWERGGSASPHPRGGNRPSLYGGGHQRHPFRVTAQQPDLRHHIVERAGTRAQEGSAMPLAPEAIIVRRKPFWRCGSLHAREHPHFHSTG